MAQFALLTDKHVFSGPNELVNDALSLRDYCWMQAWNRKKSIKGGKGIRDFIKLDTDRLSQITSPGARHTVQARGSSVEHEIAFARRVNQLSWLKEEVQDNEGDPRAQYKNIYATKRMDMVTDNVESFEDDLWADPVDAMEIGIGDTTNDPSVNRVPLSIPALITTNGTSAFPTATTKAGINPTTNPNWQNQYETFSNFENDFENVMFDMLLKIDWKKPAVKPSEFTGTPMDGIQAYTSPLAGKLMRNILRDSNDNMTRLGEYDTLLTYGPLAFKLTEKLGAIGQSESEQDGIKIYVVNWDFLYPVVRRDYWMKLIDNNGKAWVEPDRPDVEFLWEYSDYNLWPKSLRRQGLIEYAA